MITSAKILKPFLVNLIYGLIFLLLPLACFPKVCSSQQMGIAHQDYMRAIGWEDDFIVMKNILKNELINRVEEKTDTYYNDNADFFSMVLLLSGVQPGDYYRLQQAGVDVIHAITADIRPFDEQSLLADVAVIGKVVGIIPEERMEDGFDITLNVEISELLKGDVPGETLQIRQRRASRLPGGDTRPELDESYLFLLSSGMYGYHKANYQLRNEDQKKEIVVSAPRYGNEKVFLIYRLYPYRNEQLYRSPQNSISAFNDLRMVDALLKQQ